MYVRFCSLLFLLNIVLWNLSLLMYLAVVYSFFTTVWYCVGCLCHKLQISPVDKYWVVSSFFFFLLQTMLLWMLVTCTSLHSKCKGFSRTHCWFHSVHDFAVTRWCQIVFQNGYINLRFKKSLGISIVSHSSQDLVLPDFLIFANLVNIK